MTQYKTMKFDMLLQNMPNIYLCISVLNVLIETNVLLKDKDEIDGPHVKYCKNQYSLRVCN